MAPSKRHRPRKKGTPNTSSKTHRSSRKAEAECSMPGQSTSSSPAAGRDEMCVAAGSADPVPPLSASGRQRSTVDFVPVLQQFEASLTAGQHHADEAMDVSSGPATSTSTTPTRRTTVSSAFTSQHAASNRSGSSSSSLTGEVSFEGKSVTPPGKIRHIPDERDLHALIERPAAQTPLDYGPLVASLIRKEEMTRSSNTGCLFLTPTQATPDEFDAAEAVRLIFSQEASDTQDSDLSCTLSLRPNEKISELIVALNEEVASTSPGPEIFQISTPDRQNPSTALSAPPPPNINRSVPATWNPHEEADRYTGAACAPASTGANLIHSPRSLFQPINCLSDHNYTLNGRPIKKVCGDGKKCRDLFIEQYCHMWCEQCARNKPCTRFLD